ncbi:hypothetical protein JX266_006462 [Neoarthrinium moseri]|nr:hypothetical protein JX266_006462 [Neoarthrinium moseri]
MKPQYLLILTAYMLGAHAASGLSDYARSIPSCAQAAFKDAAASNDCSTTAVDANELNCLCKHRASITMSVSQNAESKCSMTFASAFGRFCGRWLAQSTAATDYPAATSAIGDVFAGKDTSGTASTASTALSSTSKNHAPAATIGPQVGVLGAVAAVAALAF